MPEKIVSHAQKGDSSLRPRKRLLKKEAAQENKYQLINTSTAIDTSSTINKRKRVELIEGPRDPKKKLRFLLKKSMEAAEHQDSHNKSINYDEDVIDITPSLSKVVKSDSSFFKFTKEFDSTEAEKIHQDLPNIHKIEKKNTNNFTKMAESFL